MDEIATDPGDNRVNKSLDYPLQTRGNPTRRPHLFSKRIGGKRVRDFGYKAASCSYGAERYPAVRHPSIPKQSGDFCMTGARQRKSGGRRRGAPTRVPRPVSGPSGTLLVPAYGPSVRIPRTLQFTVTKPAADSGFLWDFALADVGSASEFTNLFTEWRLDAVGVNMVWNPSAAVGAPRFSWAMDPMATANPASLSELEQRRPRMFAPNSVRNTMQLLIKPEATLVSQSDPGGGATLGTMLARPNAWLSTGSTNISYGRLLMWGENFNTGNTSAGDLRLVFTYHFCFRGAK